MKKRWVLKDQGDQKIVKHLSEELNIDSTLANLLVQRGIYTFDEAKKFFRPQLSDLHDPFLMKDMDKAVARILNAIDNFEKILIYGDYDVDGTTAVALVLSFLKKSYSNVDFYIPDRYKEGYGISKAGIDYAYRHNFSLIVVLDCGIKAIDQVNYANSKHIDFVICDHHLPDEEIPNAHAVLDPKRPDCTYPYKELSGCGIGFKLIQALAEKMEVSFNSRVKPYLDLVVLSIASDIVPITGENRVLAYYGLKKINTSPRPGIEAIIKYTNISKRSENDDLTHTIFSKQLTVSDLVFIIGPRINAAGRIDEGRYAVELLISKNIEYAYKLGKNIDTNNTERKTLDMSATQEAIEMIASSPELLKKRSTLLYNPNWHKGVIGIVASRLIENYYKPTIVMTQFNGLITGSARSIKDFDIYSAIRSCSDLLENFGGHKYAAGMTIKPENLEAFKKRFEKAVADAIKDDMLIPEIEIDAEIDLKAISPKFFRVLKQFAPFGPQNMSPIFLTRDVKDTGAARIVGNNHIKLNIIQELPERKIFPAIAFQQGESFDIVNQGKKFNICYHVEENCWNGSVSLQLNINDIHPE